MGILSNDNKEKEKKEKQEEQSWKPKEERKSEEKRSKDSASEEQGKERSSSSGNSSGEKKNSAKEEVRKLEEEEHIDGTPSELDDTEVDVVLEVPELKVDRININVEDLDAKLDVDIDALELVKLDAGVRAHLEQVEVNIQGVRAEAYLQVRLARVKGILYRVNEMVDNNADMLAEVLEPIARGAQGATEGIGEGLKGATGQSEEKNE